MFYIILYYPHQHDFIIKHILKRSFVSARISIAILETIISIRLRTTALVNMNLYLYTRDKRIYDTLMLSKATLPLLIFATSMIYD